jgi:hypothetical protein
MDFYCPITTFFANWQCAVLRGWNVEATCSPAFHEDVKNIPLLAGPLWVGNISLPFSIRESKSWHFCKEKICYLFKNSDGYGKFLNSFNAKFKSLCHQYNNL